MEITGAKLGCLIIRIPVQPGNWYVISGDCRQVGGDTSYMQIEGINAGGKLMVDNRTGAAFSEELQNGWKRGVAVVRAPQNAVFLTVLAMVSNQKPGDICRFDNICSYNLGELLKP